jgi:hypothetical protein
LSQQRSRTVRAASRINAYILTAKFPLLRLH